MRSKARAARLPRKLLRGQKMLDGISGEEIYQRASTTRFQRGMFMHKKNYDTLTTVQMEEALLVRLSGNTTTPGGQGNEKPSPLHQTYGANDAYGSSNIFYA